MFAYCNSNPVNSSDSLGFRPVSILERYGDKSIYVPQKKIITPQTSESNLSTTSSPTATFSFGGSINGNIGPTTYGGQLFITLDSEGFIALQYSIFSGTSAGPDSDKLSGGIAPFVMMTNAGKYSDIDGPGFAVGASYGGYSLDYIGALDINNTEKINYHGIAITLPVINVDCSSGNFHITGSNTGTILAVPFDWDTYYKITQY